VEERLLKVEEVALLVGSSVKTINNWYAWKKVEPEHELAKLLPDFIQTGSRKTRYWKQGDIWMLIKFKQSLPKGRNGVLGKVTQKYYVKKEDVQNVN
jgi:predicted DNA-binding transcriptional regulator AlpA